MNLQNLSRLLSRELQTKSTTCKYLVEPFTQSKRFLSKKRKKIRALHDNKTVLNYKVKDYDQIEPIDPKMIDRNFFLNEPNPANHLTKHQGLFYTISKEVNNTLFAVYGWNQRQKLIFETFDEASIMIRKYALDVMEGIRKGELLGDKFERIIFHGLTGSGKSLTLNHLIHYAHRSNFVVVHLNEILNLTRLPFEYKPSESRKKEGRVDTPINSSMLLQHFKAQNEKLIKDLKLSKTYSWSLKEKNEKDEPLVNIIDHGINRSDHSSDCYAVLIKELKLAAEQGLIKLFIAIEDINFMYWPTDLRRPDWTYYTTMDVTVTRALRKLVSSDFKNGLLVATTEKRNHPRWDPDEQKYSDDPYELLLDDGVRELKNFNPIKIGPYEDFEFYNCLAYYNDRMFITHPKALTTEGLEQIKFLTTKLPKDVFEQMKWL